MLAAGCGKKSAATPTPTPAQGPASATNPDPSAPASTTPAQPGYNPPASPPPAIATTADGGPDLKQLNHYYIGWILQNRQRPKTFEQFVAASGVQVPPAPTGKKYVIDSSGFINLVNR